MVVFVELAGGALALAKRPKLVELAKLKAAGATHLVTLLAERDARQLGKAAEAAGLVWTWMPIEHGDPPPQERDREYQDKLDRIIGILEGGGRVVLHCSAGIHRTGMIAYALLRLVGRTPEAARTTLAELREETALGVGEHRMAWGDRLAIR